ncbi:3917_t:CDS:2 [Diversispora eburnea]|uniref:3917_t:CDS:1 n=1 Tax=Diversispora eburnea TaxID=1213867 RepID=A0A9N9AV95_9GLOM|nr:3917_t:CDS:2 [Diversispora eburnea]
MSHEVRFPDEFLIYVPVPNLDEAHLLIDKYRPTTQSSRSDISTPHARYIFILQIKKCLIDYFPPSFSRDCRKCLIDYFSSSSLSRDGNGERSANYYLTNLSSVAEISWRNASSEYREEYQRLCRNPSLKAKLEDEFKKVTRTLILLI